MTDLLERRLLEVADRLEIGDEQRLLGDVLARLDDAPQAYVSRRPRLALMLLEDLRLILRVVRRYTPARYAGLVAAVLEAVPAFEVHSSCSVPRPSAGGDAIRLGFAGESRRVTTRDAVIAFRRAMMP